MPVIFFHRTQESTVLPQICVRVKTKINNLNIERQNQHRVIDELCSAIY